VKLTKLVPGFLKPLLRPAYRAFLDSSLYRRFKHNPKCREELHEFWKDPYDGGNRPEDYLEGEGKSEFLLQIIDRHLPKSAKIMEIGCNVGRNLNFLYQSGRTDLSAIEISETAVRRLRESYPEMASQTKIYNQPVEEAIATFSDGEFDLVFTMAVLEHIHDDSKWIFAEMVRIAGKVLITIEDERFLSWRHFPRNYRKILEPLGMKQVEEVNCREVPLLSENFVARVFAKEN
jgi:SAM-dependent methyltransferase